MAVDPMNPQLDNLKTHTYLALGDSYTVGESVPTTKSFPAQVVEKLQPALKAKIKFDVIAATGWRTDDLLQGIHGKFSDRTFDFVTLLIGVNNQYQERHFSQYEREFPQLLEKAIAFADNNPDRVAVVSIPDYGYTPFGKNRDKATISNEINAYNAFAEATATAADVRFINITDITRRGLDEPDLVADDGLHPSAKAYKLFASRIAPFMLTRLKD